MSAESESKPGSWPIEPALEPEQEGMSRSWRGLALLGIGVALLLAIVYLSPLREYLAHLREVSSYVRSFGLWAPAVAVLGVAILVAVGFPRLLFCVIAGMAFGFWRGLLWAQLGTLLGNYMVFVLVRSGGSFWFNTYLKTKGKLHHLVQREGVVGVILARQLPLPGLIVNVGCALLHVRHRHYLLGTALGQLPQAIPCTLIGAGILQASFTKSLGLIALAVGVALLGWIVLQRWLRKI